MPQPGIHGVLALATRRTFSRRRWFALGLVFGALFPDTDGYAQAFGVLVQGIDNQTAEAVYHRTFTHTLFFPLAVLIVIDLVSFLRGGRDLRTFGLGLGIGMALLHSMVDIIGWFDGVGLLWPLWSVNLWERAILPEVIKNLLRAANFWAFLWYFIYLISLARKAGTDTAYLPNLRRWTTLQGALGVAFTALALFLPTRNYNVLDGAVFLFLAYPNVLWVTWKMRDTIMS
jgi:membrane-bound metal-dependent hydrolase YbcI (DUF457 family)